MVKLFARMGLFLWLSLMTAGVASAQTAPVAPGSAPAASAASSGYVLASGDRLRITVYGEERLSGEFAVTTTGQISFPLIGNLDVAGLSLTDAQKLIHDRLADGYLKDPRVTAEFISFRPYYVLGEVARPGQFPYVDGLTLRQAIAAAGGFTYRARRSRVFLMVPGAVDEVRIDLEREPNRAIRPGETVRVGERFF